MNAYLLPGLLAAPPIYAAILKQMPSEQFDQPTAEGRFTPREVMAHLAEWEPILREERIRQVLEQPGRTVLAYDEGDMAVAGNYRALDVQESLARFAAERQLTASLVGGLTPAQFDTPLVHVERGAMTLRDSVNTMLGHDLYHIEQLLNAGK